MGLYLNIEGIKPGKFGAVTADEIGGLKDLIRIDSASISRSNSIYFEVGNMQGSTGGNLGFSELSVSRVADGVTSFLTSWFYKQISEPKKVTMIVTKAGGGTIGDVPVYKVELTDCSLTSQSLSVGFDGQMSESLSIVYQAISEVFYSLDDDGTYKAGSAAGYNLAENKLVSEAK